MLTILFHYWRDPDCRTEYTADYVNRAAVMTRRHLTLEHEIACVTDTPEGLDSSIRVIEPLNEFVDVNLPTWSRAKGMPQCLRRLSLFRPDAEEIFGGKRLVSMDVDCVIGGSLDPLFDRPEDFVMYRGTKGAERAFNGSLLMLTAGARPEVYKKFTPKKAAYASEAFTGSDQAWVSRVLGGKGEATWDEDDGVLWFNRRFNPETARIMFFPGSPKPWDFSDHSAISDRNRWIKGNYFDEELPPRPEALVHHG